MKMYTGRVMWAVETTRDYSSADWDLFNIGHNSYILKRPISAQVRVRHHTLIPEAGSASVRLTASDIDSNLYHLQVALSDFKLQYSIFNASD
jgi:hypothetical protein